MGVSWWEQHPWLCRNTSCCSHAGGRVWFHSVVLLDSLPSLIFLKAVVGPSPSWTHQPFKENIPSLESLWQEPEALRSHTLWEHQVLSWALLAYVLGWLFVCSLSGGAQAVGGRWMVEKNFCQDSWGGFGLFSFSFLAQ